VNVKKVALNGSLVRNMTISHISCDATNKYNSKEREREERWMDSSRRQAPSTTNTTQQDQLLLHRYYGAMISMFLLNLYNMNDALPPDL
jgi:Fe2+ transport system protein B